jgi:hypothetical protein
MLDIDRAQRIWLTRRSGDAGGDNGRHLDSVVTPASFLLLGQIVECKSALIPLQRSALKGAADRRCRSVELDGWRAFGRLRSVFSRFRMLCPALPAFTLATCRRGQARSAPIPVCPAECARHSWRV